MSQTPNSHKAITHGEVYRLAWPMIISNCSVPLLGIVDTALLGHLESPVYLGAVAVGSSLLTFLLWAFGFLRMGTTGQVAQAFGQQQLSECTTILVKSLCLALIIALAVLALSPLVISIGVLLMGPTPEIASLTAEYAAIRIFGAPATLSTYVIVGWFIGIQRTREPLIIALFVNTSNIILDWLFIVVFNLSSNGAATATVIAEYGGLALALVLISKNLPAPIGPMRFRSILTGCKSLLTIHSHLFVRTLCLLFVFALFTALGARQGEIILAANAILLQLLSLVSYGLDGYAHAAEALIGRTWGAKDFVNFRRTCRYTAQWSFWTALTFTLLYAFAQTPLISAFTDLPVVAQTTETYFPWLLALPLISFVSYWLDGVFIGAGMTTAMRNAVFLAATLVYLPIWWILSDSWLIEDSGSEWTNHGLWFALISFNGVRGLIMAYYYRKIRQHWERKTL